MNLLRSDSPVPRLTPSSLITSFFWKVLLDIGTGFSFSKYTQKMSCSLILTMTLKKVILVC